MAEYLVELGIDSMSLNPDTVVKTTRQVLALEEKLGRSPVTAPEPGSRVEARVLEHLHRTVPQDCAYPGEPLGQSRAHRRVRLGSPVRWLRTSTVEPTVASGQICSGTMSMAPHGHSLAQMPHPLQKS